MNIQDTSAIAVPADIWIINPVSGPCGFLITTFAFNSPVLRLFLIKRWSCDPLFIGIISSMSCDITESDFLLYIAYQKTFFCGQVCG